MSRKNVPINNIPFSLTLKTMFSKKLLFHTLSIAVLFGAATTILMELWSILMFGKIFLVEPNVYIISGEIMLASYSLGYLAYIAILFVRRELIRQGVTKL